MTEKSDLWDIVAEAKVTFKRVYFDQEVTEKEAIRLFKEGNFNGYEEVDVSPEEVSKVIYGEAY